nr:transcriptional regulator AfsR [Actinomadura rugatobispora]
MPSLRFTVLGPPRARRGTAELPLGPPQQRAVLVALLLRDGRPATAQELVDAVWGDQPPRRALGALRTYASGLRRVLEPGRGGGPRGGHRILVSVGDGYALRLPPDALDAALFEREAAAAGLARSQGRAAEARDLLRTALGRWRGEPLSGVPGPYARAQRIRLAERRLAALETRLELDLELGAHAELVPELTALVAEHPLRERLRGLLMLALHRTGRHADALAVYAETRRTLVEDLGIEPGQDLSALHRRLLAETGPAPPETSESEGPPDGPVPPARSPAQLPGDVPDFTGRARLVEELRETLLAEPRRAVAMVTVAGAAGVGKTALALHVAHRVRSGFPGGQLYADLRGAGSDPADPHNVLGAFLQALGVERDAIPAGLSERAALYRTRLAERRVLVLLDDARDARQIRPLLPGSPGCAVLVTSRSKPAGPGAGRQVDLDVMEPGEARALAARIVGEERLDAEPAAVRDLLAACGHLPLAVRIVASRLAARPSWTVASLVERLADRRRRLAELRVADLAVEAVFQLGYNQLDAAQRRAFRLLALAEGPTLSREAAAALLGVPEYDADELCESLVDASLLRSPTAGRYRYHELLKLYARQRAEADEPPAERAAALHRLFHFYLATARAAHLMVSPGDGRAGDALLPAAVRGLPFDGTDAARDWFFAEAPSLFAAIVQAARAPGADGAAPAERLPLAAELLLMTDALVSSGVHARECEQAAYAVLDAAWEHRDQRSEGRAHLHLGWVCYYADRLDDSAAVTRVAVRRGRESGDLWTVADALLLNGRGAIALHRHEEALRHCIEALDAFRRLGDRYGEANTLGALARALLGMDRAEEALTAAEHGLALHRELGGVDRTGDGLYQLGVVLRGVGRPDEAIERQRDAQKIFRSRRNRRWEGLAMFRVAEAQADLGRAREAAAEAREALRILRDTGHDWGQGHALRVLADALGALGRPTEARALRRQALRHFEHIRIPEAGRMRALLDDDASDDALPQMTQCDG